MGSKEDVAARIEADTKIKIDEMQKAVNTHKEAVCTIHILILASFIFDLQNKHECFRVDFIKRIFQCLLYQGPAYKLLLDLN
jgi:V-type H+-transporting ATPase subunit G